MTTNYTENESSKKKYLAPLVVIMLCAVALTGAAYAAYATSVTGNGDIAGKYAVLDIYDEKGGVQTDIPLATNSEQIKVYTTTDKTGDSDEYVAHVDKTEITFEIYVKVNTDLSGKTFNLTVTQGEYKKADNAGSLTFSDMKITTIYSTTKSTTVTVLDGGDLCKVTITCNVIGGTATESEGTPDGIYGSYSEFGDESSGLVQAVNALKTSHLVITLSAEEVSAP